MGNNFITPHDIQKEDTTVIVKHVLNNTCPNDIEFLVYQIPIRDKKKDCIPSKISELCVICKKLKVVHQIIPCKHKCICNRCLDDIGTLKLSICPANNCNQKIERII